MTNFRFLVPARDENFDETAYLAANPDVAAAMAAGIVPSARAHYEIYGEAEGRMQRRSLPIGWKDAKLGRIRPLLRDDVIARDTMEHVDCLSDELRQRFGVVSTDRVSAHDYDEQALQIITRHQDGLVLDCGAGRRSVYYTNVVNVEIVAYDSTDVLAVAECLPFHDESFDAVLSLNLLEHVKNPFLVARELVRVLKPGGELMCVAPFLQPLHGYPSHYFNMTREGLVTLFEGLESPQFALYGAMHPIWALSWFLQCYVAGLPEDISGVFKAMTIADLLQPPHLLEQQPIARQLAPASCIELANAHALFARKPAAPTSEPNA